MADLSGITAVKVTPDTLTSRVVYGETVDPGELVYLPDGGDEYMLADGDNTTDTANASGLAITGGDATESGEIAIAGSVILVGTTMTVSETYIASDNPGKIKPIGDKVTGDIVTHIGTASTTTQLDLKFNATGVTAL